MFMKDVIKEMIAQADDERNFELIRWIKEILDEFTLTCDCPSDWRYIGAELARECQTEQQVGIASAQA